MGQPKTGYFLTETLSKCARKLHDDSQNVILSVLFARLCYYKRDLNARKQIYILNGGAT